MLTRLLVPGEHYISVPLPPAAHNICTTLTDAVAWADANPRRAQVSRQAPSPLAPRPNLDRSMTRYPSLGPEPNKAHTYSPSPNAGDR